MAFIDDTQPRIAYSEFGAGRPIVLVHGFASNRAVNWIEPSWTADLAAAGFRVTAIDNRGHGESGKLYEPADYATALMASDLLRVFDALRIETADLMGYSMGARISLVFALSHPERLRSLVLSGFGARSSFGAQTTQAIADGLLAEDPTTVADPTARSFRTFADRTRSDRRALAACIRGTRQPLDVADLARLAVPTLVAVGSEDDVAGDPRPVADALPTAELFVIPRRDHMRAVGDRAHKAAVLDFLARH